MEEEPLNQDDIEVLLIIKNILAFIPLILLFLISLLFWYLKKIKKRMIYMNIFYLMLIEICYLICIVLPYNYNEPDSSLCIAESLLINFFTHCKYVWCFLMIYTSIMESLFPKQFNIRFILFSIIIISVLILIPLCSSLFLYLNKLTGNFGTYCYLPLNNEEMRYYVVRIHIYYTGIKVFFIIMNSYGIFRSSRNKKALRKITKFTSNHKYLLYPKLICSLQTLDLITNIYKIISINSSTFFIELLHIIFISIEGISILAIFIKSPLFQILFAEFYKNIKKRRGKKKKIKKNKKMKSLYKIIGDNNTAPLINDKDNEEN